MRKRIHSSTRIVLAAACLGLVAVAVQTTSATALLGPSLKATPKEGLTPNQTVSLVGKRLVGDTGDYLAQCEPTATATSGCDLSTEVLITVAANGNLTSPTSFTVVGPGDGTCGVPALGQKVLTCEISLVAGSVVTPLAKVTFPNYYISLGDSYSVGYQPVPLPDGAATTGYTGYIAKKEKLTLENYGCGGATSASLTAFTGVCGTPGSYGPPAAFGAATIPPGESQVTAADNFMTAHPGQIGLITVSIGGNDVTPCALAAPGNPVNGATDPVTCVENGVGLIQANVAGVVGALNTAAGGTVPIVGLTYPDVLLGLWVCTPLPDEQCGTGVPGSTLAEDSTGAFYVLINPTLKAAYTSVPSGKFVDITEATGAYTPLTTLKNLPPYGKIPLAVAEVCKYTWYCSMGNIHANDAGYTFIGKQVVAAL